MNFAFNITTPKSTPESSKQKTVLNLVRGKIIKVEVQFPPGPQGLLHVHINRANHQIWPFNPDSSYVGDAQIIVIPADYYLDQPPYQLECYTWNEDDTFEHMCIIRIDIMVEKPEQEMTAEDIEKGVVVGA